jgi:catechol 2,3-dioxygenase-like lactoylglutathione lyase family enzyme
MINERNPLEVLCGRMSEPIVTPLGFSHVRLTVTDIRRSKAFYERLFGMPPGSDFSDQIDDPTIHDDPWRTYGGCSFTFGGQTLGLRPVAPAGDRFDADRIGLDHVSFRVASVDELHAAVGRLDAAGIEHGEVTDLPPFGLVILSVQDPDDVNLEFAAPRA